MRHLNLHGSNWSYSCSSDWLGEISVSWLKGETRYSFIIVDFDGINEGIVQETESLPGIQSI